MQIRQGRNTMDNTTTMLNVSELYENPANPRKDLGDLTELSESIKVNGVLQSLTVIPRDKGGYTVVIGHRRLAAAKLAGVTELPCVVSEMDEKSALNTMLMENMQRENLSISEQAKGMQLALDLGASISELSKATGFSKKTISHRVKIASLDDKAVKKATARGASIMDFAKLEDIEDDDAKNELAEKYIGTKEFDFRLKEAIEKQEVAKKIADFEQRVGKWAVKIDSTEGKFYCGSVNDEASADAPPDDNAGPFYYLAPEKINTWSRLSIYSDTKDYETDEERTRKARYEKNLLGQEKYDSFIKKRSELVTEFIMSLSEKDIEKEKQAVCSITLPALIGRRSITMEAVSDALKCLGLEFSEGSHFYYDFSFDEIGGFADLCGKTPLKVLFLMQSCCSEIKYAYINRTWHNDDGYLTEHEESAFADKFYDVLEKMGYQMSSEEESVKDGTSALFDEHKAYLKKKEEEAAGEAA